MLARHIHPFMSDEEEAGVFLSPPSVDPSRAPPTGDAQVTPVAGERRGRVRPPQVLHIHFHHLHHLRPRLHFTAFSPVDRRAPLVTAGPPGPAPGPRAVTVATGLTWSPGIRQLSEQPGELSDGPAHLLTLLSAAGANTAVTTATRSHTHSPGPPTRLTW